MNTPAPRRINRFWKGVLVVLVIILLAMGGFVIWALTPVGELLPEVAVALQSSDSVTVTTQNWVTFMPDNPPVAGFIFYPGGKVQAEAYAPLMRSIADAGYLSVIVYAPLNLAIFNPDMATPVLEQFSAVDTWVLAGHSLGGSAAAIYTNNHLADVDGLVFLASYPVDDTLVQTNLPVLSIYGTNDGLASAEEIESSRSNLPASAQFVAIDGGNHAQFGYYGDQPSDLPATISRDEQQAQTLTAILDFMAGITAPAQ